MNSNPSGQRKRISLQLEDGSCWEGFSFGKEISGAGEVVFNTGMTGYPESLTDPSYFGQILVCTYPLIGNYGVPGKERNYPAGHFESDRIQVKGLVVSDYSEDYSHWDAGRSLSDWLQKEGIPAVTGIDTRSLTRHLREQGTMPGKLICTDDPGFYDPNTEGLLANVSLPEPLRLGRGKRRVAILDCGCKRSILRQFLERGVEILRLPWNYALQQADFDALFVSNGPGDPKTCPDTIAAVRWALDNQIPTLGICLGHQILALAAGADTYKLKYGHRSQNQPVIENNSHNCLITSQNHGFAVDTNTLPDDWQVWFTNLNDQTNEGIIHRSGQFMSVQFHPEASPGPEDAAFIFDRFLQLIPGRTVRKS